MKFPDLGLNAPQRLRDLIRDIRSAKTLAEEREVAQREGAAIRDSFRSEDNVYRCRNVAKLLYLYLLGYPAHYGQLECLKLIASHSYTDKRIGYLGAALLLDERQNISLMITNSLKNDLNHSSQYIAGLALSTLGAICSEQMGRDLVFEVEKFVKCINPYLKKKAVLCACRIISKFPESVDMFVPHIERLLIDKSHDILCATMSLVLQIIKYSPGQLETLKKIAPILVRTLRSLLMTSFNPEYDVCSISDPFLQCNVLKVMRILGKDDAGVSESMNDILAQVVTSTDGIHNAGNAVLYDAVLTIMNIKSESGLRVLAINILGRFLLNSDKNVKYVALGVLLEVVKVDRQAVKRHSSMILECLDDFDVSLKRRSMELCFAIIDQGNIVQMTTELLNFLGNCEEELRGDCASEMFSSIEKYAPSKTWLIDQCLLIFQVAGNHIRDDMVSMIIGSISSTNDPNVHTYTCRELLKLSSDETSLRALGEKQPLYQVVCWCFGEYGHSLMSSVDSSGDTMVDVIEAVLKGQSSVATKSYALNCLMKLSVYSKDFSRINQLIGIFSDNISLELQTRSVEYGNIVQKYDSLRSDVYSSMPAFESKRANLMLGDVSDSVSPSEDSNSKGSVNLLTLIDTSTENDILSELMGETKVSDNSLLDILEIEKRVTVTAPTEFATFDVPKSSKGTICGYKNNDVKVDFKYEYSEQSNTLTLCSIVTNLMPVPMYNCTLQVAVPKSQTLTIHPANCTTLSGRNAELKQEMVVVNKSKEKIRLRIRFIYNAREPNGEQKIVQTTVSNFPEECWR